MSLYKIDRVQQTGKEFFLFEFIELDFVSMKSCIAELVQCNGLIGTGDVIRGYVPQPMRSKLDFISKLYDQHDFTLFIIVYDTEHRQFCLIGTCFEEVYYPSFAELQEWFLKVNSGNANPGKRLGKATNDEDNNVDFVNTVLEDIGQQIEASDDCGLQLTKKLLDGTGTKGFDLDLFQYIESTQEYLIFEFLRRKNSYVTNYTAHPMRYCWTGNVLDNKQKFISLWQAKQKFNARLYLVNYSDHSEVEGIGLIEVTGLKDQSGFTSERKYNLRYEEFIAWLRHVSHYQGRSSDYLQDYRHKLRIYDEVFFLAFHANKSRYGK